MKKQLLLLGCLLVALSAVLSAEEPSVVLWTDGGYLLNAPWDEQAWHGVGGGGEFSIDLPIAGVPISIQVLAGYRADRYALPAASYGEDAIRGMQAIHFGASGTYRVIPRLYVGGGVSLVAFFQSSADIQDTLMVVSSGSATAMYVTAKAGYVLLDLPKLSIPVELRLNAGVNAPATFPMEFMLAVGVAVKT